MDYTYILVVIGAIICLIASARMNSTFNRYQRVRSMSGMTGAMAAERILRDAGIHDVQVQHVSGNLTDHYNPMNKTLSLSDSVYNSTSVAACKRICSAACSWCFCAGGKYRFQPGMAADHYRTDLSRFHEYGADSGRNHYVFPGGTVSADHTAGRV